jgi:hypothetical protein
VTERLGLIVTDGSPLVTLGAAGALDCLLMPAVPAFIPDMVHTEAAHDMARLGAGEVATWIRAHEGQVRTVPTEVYAEFEALRAINPNTRFQDRGERAALEVLNYKIAADPDLQAMLLFEDIDIHRRRFVHLLPERVRAISTGDFFAGTGSGGPHPISRSYSRRSRGARAQCRTAAAADDRGRTGPRHAARANWPSAEPEPEPAPPDESPRPGGRRGDDRGAPKPRNPDLSKFKISA